MQKTIFLLFFSCLIFIGCSPKQSALFDDTECSLPCWREIEFGLSKNDAISSVLSMADVHMESIEMSPMNRPFEDEGLSWDFINRREIFGSFSYYQTSLIKMGFTFIEPYSINEVIKIIGEPDSVFIYSTVGGGKEYSKAFYLYNNGICLTHAFNPPPDSSTYFIKPSDKIQEIILIDQSNESDQTKFGCLWGFDESIFYKNLQKWQGFEEYEMLQKK